MFGLRFEALGLAVLLAALPAAAAEVGTVAALQGKAEIGRVAVWTEARIGSAIEPGDEIRTGRPGRMRIVFQDDTVLNLGDDSRIAVDEQVFDPAAGQSRSLLKLLGGRVRSLVSEYYERHGASYEIETPTAVSGVRGTEFVVRYDPALRVTEVVAISGRVEVHSVLDRAARGVYLTAGEMSQVEEGGYPTYVPKLEDRIFRQVIEGVQFSGLAGTGTLAAAHPLVGGAGVPEPDRAPPVVEGPAESNEAPTAATLVDQPLRSAGRGDLGVRF